MHQTNLRDEIRQFQKRKMRFAIPILLLGVLGLVLPIIPGVALIMLGILLLFPMQGRRLIDRIRRFIRKFFRGSETREA